MNLHLTTMTQAPTKQLQKINIRHYTFTRSTRLDHTQVSGRVVPSIDIFSEKNCGGCGLPLSYSIIRLTSPQEL